MEHVSGKLTDHYDPKAGVIRLSDSVYASSSVAAIGVAAHEAGHAVQYAVGYVPIKVRNAVIPLSQFGSSLSMPVLLIGCLLYTSTGCPAEWKDRFDPGAGCWSHLDVPTAPSRAWCLALIHI